MFLKSNSLDPIHVKYPIPELFGWVIWTTFLRQYQLNKSKLKQCFSYKESFLKVKESFQTEIATCFVINNAIIEDEIPKNVKQNIIKRP